MPTLNQISSQCGSTVVSTHLDWHTPVMRGRIALLATIALYGCDTSTNAPAPARSETHTATTSIPHDHSAGFRDGYLVQVSRRGSVTWNGQTVDSTTLRDYLNQYSKLPRDAGRLWVEFEPGLPTQAAEAIRKMIVASGLCAQQRCVEGAWGVERPVVY